MNARPGSAIYYLLQAGERSAWHRIDAAEVWHLYAGAALELRIAPACRARSPPSRLVLGPDLEAGQRPQLVVPAGDWQSSASLGDWTLVGCTVSPAFEFRSFELAEPGWEPGAPPTSRVIRVVGANPAMDRISTWPNLRLGEVNRAASVAVVPGGKGFNVARAAIRLGSPATAYGFLGGPVGESLREMIRADGVIDRHTDIAGGTRVCFIVVEPDAGRATVLNEPGPPSRPRSRHASPPRIAADCQAADALVLSGSLPDSLDPRLAAEIVAIGHAAGARTFVDIHGASLRAVVGERPWMLKCNRDELLGLLLERPPTAVELDRHQRRPLADVAREMSSCAARASRSSS